MSYSDRQVISTPVVVVNIKVGFWRLVSIFVKFILASIPATIIACVIIGALIAGVYAILGMFGFHPEHYHQWMTDQARPGGPVVTH
jgi:hypothetical protein